MDTWTPFDCLCGSRDAAVSPPPLASLARHNPPSRAQLPPSSARSAHRCWPARPASSPTDAGADFLARVEAILADLEEAEHAARGSGELRGLLRVGIGSSLAVRMVIPRLKPFLDQHPALQVELMLDDQRQDLLAEG